MSSLWIKDFILLINLWYTIFQATCKKWTGMVWKTCWNVKAQWLYNENLLDYMYHQIYHKLCVDCQDEQMQAFLKTFN